MLQGPLVPGDRAPCGAWKSPTGASVNPQPGSLLGQCTNCRRLLAPGAEVRHASQRTDPAGSHSLSSSNWSFSGITSGSFGACSSCLSYSCASSSSFSSESCPTADNYQDVQPCWSSTSAFSACRGATRSKHSPSQGARRSRGEHSHPALWSTDQGGWGRRTDPHHQVPGWRNEWYCCPGCSSSPAREDGDNDGRRRTASGEHGKLAWQRAAGCYQACARRATARGKSGPIWSKRRPDCSYWGSDCEACKPRGHFAQARHCNHWPWWQADHPTEARPWWRSTSDCHPGQDQPGHAGGHYAQGGTGAGDEHCTGAENCSDGRTRTEGNPTGCHHCQAGERPGSARWTDCKARRRSCWSCEDFCSRSGWKSQTRRSGGRSWREADDSDQQASRRTGHCRGTAGKQYFQLS